MFKVDDRGERYNINYKKDMNYILQQKRWIVAYTIKYNIMRLGVVRNGLM